ncbi:MAG: DUF4141 domain-containing protein [Patescibacteria group bacterium]
MNYGKKIIILSLVFILIFSPITARRADAQWLVLDPGNLAQAILKVVKDFGLDGVAWGLVNSIINRLAGGVVNWINSGFKGSPAFVTDPTKLLQQISDDTAGFFIAQDPRLKALCGPLASQVRIALAKNYAPRWEDQWQCTLTDIGANFDDFINDFDRGGWEAFYHISQFPQNNPLGSYIMAEGELIDRIAQKQEVQNKELNWGKGFLSFKACARYAGLPESARTIDTPVKNPDGSFGNKKVVQPDTCLEQKTTTPGTAIEERLNKALGAGEGRLQVADEINEIVGALISQLTNKVLSSVGLAGLSTNNPTSGGGQGGSVRTYADMLAQTSATSSQISIFCEDPNDPDPSKCNQQNFEIADRVQEYDPYSDPNIARPAPGVWSPGGTPVTQPPPPPTEDN